MSVLPLTPGPVLALSPALLSFSANDGQATPPAAQTLTISNPGTRPLSWSLASPSQDQATATAQLSLLHALGPAGNWLSASSLSGVVAPGATAAIQVIVSSQSILPGTYTGTLLFTAPGAIDSPQAVNVSLTVFPHCGIVTNSGFLSFTAVQGQSTLGTQALSLSATVSCAGAAITWKSLWDALLGSGHPRQWTVEGHHQCRGVCQRQYRRPVAEHLFRPALVCHREEHANSHSNVSGTGSASTVRACDGRLTAQPQF